MRHHVLKASSNKRVVLAFEWKTSRFFANNETKLIGEHQNRVELESTMQEWIVSRAVLENKAEIKVLIKFIFCQKWGNIYILYLILWNINLL